MTANGVNFQSENDTRSLRECFQVVKPRLDTEVKQKGTNMRYEFNEKTMIKVRRTVGSGVSPVQTV